MNITTNTTLPLPPNGIFNCTTITVASNATLTFTPNALNTPVYLLAQGDVAINGTIDVSGYANAGAQGGLGGPGGFAGANGGYLNLPGGDGHGPGGGHCAPGLGPNAVGSAWSATNPQNARGTTNNGSVYGSPLLIPLVGGSGGGGTSDGPGGSGGGGAVLIASNTRIYVGGSLVSSSANFRPRWLQRLWLWQWRGDTIGCACHRWKWKPECCRRTQHLLEYLRQRWPHSH